MSRAKPVVLVDGSAYLYRAFHALPPLTSPAGQPTGAIYGVVNMLRRLLGDYDPERLAVVFDAPGKTFRDDLYPEYKANRDAMPDDMRVQITPLHQAVEAMGLPMLVVPGVEADDVIGTLAHQAIEADLPVVISTGDKDMAQLVNSHVTLVDTMRNSRMDSEGVMAKFGVRPDQIVDYLALVGDSSDNIPGVPSCGPKTAAKWLGEHDTLDAIMAGAAAVKGKIGEKLRASLEILPLSRQLATIVKDLELPVSLHELEFRAPDIEGLGALYEELGFRSWRTELAEGRSPVQTRWLRRTGQGTGQDKHPGSAKVPAKVPAEVPAQVPAEAGGEGDEAPPLDPAARAAAAAADSPYETILTQAALDAWLARLEAAELFAFDTETTSLNYMQAAIVGVSFALPGDQAAYVPLAHAYEGAPEQLDRERVLEQLRPLLESDTPRLVGQHLKYDANVLRNHGIQLSGIAHDTMLQSYVLDATATRHDMDSLARRYLEVETTHFEDVAGRGKKQVTFDQVDVTVASHYAAEDADVTLRLHEVLWPKLQAEPRLMELYQALEMPLLSLLADIEFTGVRVDGARLEAQGELIGQRMAELEMEAHAEAGKPFNLGSPKQIQEILYDEKQLPILKKTPKGQPSTAEDVLEQLAAEYDLPRLILQHRSLSKLKSTYIDKLPGQINPRTGRVHTSYHQAVASTGRLSSSDPNLQNIPIRTTEGRRIREAFLPAEGYRLLAADYSQIELRIMAHLSEDEGLLTAFANGLDIHRATAAEVFGLPLDAVDGDQRRAAKAINFGLIYGMSAFGLARQLGIPRGEAKDYIDLYFSRYPGVRRYMEETRLKAGEQGYVETVFGRRLYLPEIHSRNAARRQYAERTAINAPMQGTAADIIKRAMIDVWGWLHADNIDARIIMQVHDELVLEVPAGAGEVIGQKVQALMSAAATLKVPLEVQAGLGNSWEEAH